MNMRKKYDVKRDKYLNEISFKNHMNTFMPFRKETELP